MAFSLTGRKKNSVRSMFSGLLLQSRQKRRKGDYIKMIKNNDATMCKEVKFSARLLRDLKRNKMLYMWSIPVLLYYFIFCYVPMSGVLMAFQNYDPVRGLTGSPFAGCKHFIDFFTNDYFWRLLRNTIRISLSSLVFGFPFPILLALLLNEVRNRKFLRTVQTITYMPYFISLVVMVGILKDFTSVDGVIGRVYAQITGNDLSMMSNPKCFVPLYVASNIWQGAGWDSILYIAALAGIDTQLYEACKLDGGGRVRQLFTVTLPGILPTIITLLILRLGNILSVGGDKIILMYNPMTYETADVISSYVYRVGLQESKWSYGAAVGLFNSGVNILFLIAANYISRKTVETSLW